MPKPENLTIDAFQGRQKRNVLVHCVAAFEGGDAFCFVKRPKRLNVGTTRSQEFQFLFGNIARWKLWEMQIRKVYDHFRHMAEISQWVDSHEQLTD